MKKKLSQMSQKEILALSNEEMERLAKKDPADYRRWKAKHDREFISFLKRAAENATPYTADDGTVIGVLGDVEGLENAESEK